MATTTGACRRVTMECGDCEHQYEDHLTRREVARLRVDPHEHQRRVTLPALRAVREQLDTHSHQIGHRVAGPSQARVPFAVPMVGAALRQGGNP